MEETILNSNDREIETEIETEIEIEKEYCSICLKDDLIDTYITDCSHTFCKICLDNWFQRGNNNCPLCRNAINSYNSDGLRYHLVIHNIPNETINNHNRESLNISGLDMQNYRLKILILCMTVPFILLFQYSMDSSYVYNNLLYDYNKCIQNSSRLIDNLNICLNTVQEGDQGTYISVFDGSESRQCFYPYKYFHACFNK